MNLFSRDVTIYTLTFYSGSSGTEKKKPYMFNMGPYTSFRKFTTGGQKKEKKLFRRFNNLAIQTLSSKS